MISNIMRCENPYSEVAMPTPTHFYDPLDYDTDADEAVVTSRRGLVRLALVAAETGARFSRESVAIDPVDWMLAPRRLFGGRAAVDACLGRDDCLRAVLLHGLSLGMDAEPEYIDDLVCADEDEPMDTDGADAVEGEGPDPQSADGWPERPTCIVHGRGEDARTHAVDVPVATRHDQAGMVLSAKHDALSEKDVTVSEGTDATAWPSEVPAPSTTARLPGQEASDPPSPSVEGLPILVHQRLVV